MRQQRFGGLWPVSALTLGGGGLGMVWGETTFDECVATVHEAVTAGINLITDHTGAIRPHDCTVGTPETASVNASGSRN
jgi:hypothetical protein